MMFDVYRFVLLQLEVDQNGILQFPDLSKLVQLRSLNVRNDSLPTRGAEDCVSRLTRLTSLLIDRFLGRELFFDGSQLLTGRSLTSLVRLYTGHRSEAVLLAGLPCLAVLHCSCFLLPPVGSTVCIPSLVELECEGLESCGVDYDVPKACALTLPGITRLILELEDLHYSSPGSNCDRSNAWFRGVWPVPSR